MMALAEVATPARGSIPPLEDECEDDGEVEVFFKGTAMIAQSTDKENKGNVQSPLLRENAPSPVAGKPGTPTSSSPASVSKKRPKPLEHVLAAKSLAGAGSPAVGKTHGATSRPRDSWVFADIVETPLAGSPTLGSKASLLSAVVGGNAFIKAASPSRGKPRESILAFSAMSPLAATPTSEAGIFGATFQSRGLFASQAPVAASDSKPAVDVPFDTCSKEDAAKFEQGTAGDKPEQGHDKELPHDTKNKKRKDSILWFNDLSKQGSSLLGRNIDLQDAFGDNFQLQEEEEEGMDDDIEVMPDEDGQESVKVGEEAKEQSQKQDSEGKIEGDSLMTAASFDDKGPSCDIGEAGVATLSAMDSPVAGKSQGAAPRSVSLLRPPAESKSKTWGLSMLDMPTVTVSEQGQGGGVNDPSTAGEDAVNEIERREAEEDLSTSVQVGPGLMIEVAREKEARSKQRSDLLHLYNECLLTKKQYQEALESLRLVGARIDGDYPDTSLPGATEAPGQDSQDRKMSVGGRASRAASPRPSHRRSDRGLSPAPNSGIADHARPGARSRASSPALTGSRRSTGRSTASYGPAASPQASGDGAPPARKARLSSSKVATPSPQLPARKSSSGLLGRPSTGSNANVSASREDSRGRQGRRSAGTGALTPRSTAANSERPAQSRRSVSKTPAGSTRSASASSAGAIRSSAVVSLRTAGGMRSIGAASSSGDTSSTSTSKTPNRAPLKANHAPASPAKSS